ncbi:MAG: DNA helicase RecG, partial [Vulcanococcus sp.]
MVSGQCPTPDSPGAPALRPEAWFRPLQQGLLLEADRGFGDLQGRREPFHGFLARELRQHPSGLTPAQAQPLLELADRFDGYGALTLAQRQALVRRTRQQLHELQRSLEPPSPVPPPRLKLVSNAAASPAADRTILPDTPLADVRGVGPKLAAKLAALDLWLARDLVRYYPRDYLDYAHLVRIAALEPGRTATIVATVRRSHSFTSPRNPNLS